MKNSKNIPNQETARAIEEAREERAALKRYSSVKELFEDLIKEEEENPHDKKP